MKKYGIAMIIDEYSVVINAGRRDGIKLNQEIKVLSPANRIVKDPFTLEPLGSINHVKDTLIVKEVKEKFSVCGSKPLERRKTESTISKSPAKLRVDDTLISKQPTYETIKVGDSIKF